MALTEPYSLAFLSNILGPLSDCQFDLIRFEEASGTGSGQQWTAELSDPLWQVTMNLSPRRWAAAREINSKLQALGTVRSFHFADPSYRPGSGGAAGNAVTISALGSDLTSIALAGLPAGYRVTAGDRLSVNRNNASFYFGTFAETVTASGAGVTAQIAVEPPLPQALAVGNAVALDRPVIRLRVPPGGFVPFRNLPGFYASGASLNLVQKL